MDRSSGGDWANTRPKSLSSEEKTNCETQRSVSISSVALSSFVWLFFLYLSPLYGVKDHTNNIFLKAYHLLVRTMTMAKTKTFKNTNTKISF